MTRLRSSSFGEARSARLAPLRGLKTGVITVAAVFIVGGTRLFACPMCFGAQESSLIDGAKLGVLALLGVLLVVQGAFAYFFFYLRKRAKENADIELDLEWSELQRGSRPS
jgi:heme/copper-type cytochrome/quinol oxidase subunit 2